MRMELRMLTAGMIMAVASQSAPAGSIWAKAGRNVSSPYSDDTARAVGDMLTILIDEKSAIANETTRTNSKKSSRKTDVSGSADMKDMVSAVRGKRAFRFPSVDVDATAENTFDGSAEFDTTRSMEDQITVAVEDVLPNGNLVVLGTRLRDIDGETQTIRISGVVRPSDITYTNTITSQRVADFRLVIKLEGSDNRFTRPGWLSWILNIIDPF